MQASKFRRLAAVMFTDIVGYTALMQTNEAAAAAIRQRHRKVFEKAHDQHHGTILQYFGDGTLSVFDSAVEAVACAVAIQRELTTEPKIPLRIGIHIGDIVFDGTEIYGDGVNLASRIESLGVAGAVLLSAALNQELKNHPNITTTSMGLFAMKNVAQPIEVFAVTNEGLTLPDRKAMKGKRKNTEKAIAVLPFVNMSASEDNAYFSDGITEEIINALTKIQNLKVTSRTSSFYYKDKTIPLNQIGKELNVSIILEGSVRLAGNKMRITAQLIDVQDDVHFWSETFDRSLEDVFAVQDEISLLIADKLREQLGHLDIGDHLVEAPKIPVESYKQYLKGRFHLLKMSQVNIELGQSYLKAIIDDHPEFALAYLGMHLSYALLGTIGFMPAGKAFMQGKPYLDKAIALDPELPECQLHLSYEAFLQKWDLGAAYEHLNKAREIRPSVEFYQSMASVLAAERKFEAAHTYIDTALQLDPFSAINCHLKGFICYCQESYSAALEWFDKGLALKTSFTASILYKGQVLIAMGRAEDGLSYFQKLGPEHAADLMQLGGTTLAYAALGDQSKVEEGVAELEKFLESPLMERAINLLMLCYAYLENKEKILPLLELSVQNRLPMMVYFYAEPLFKPLHAEPKVQALMQQVLGVPVQVDLSRKKYKKPLFTDVQLRQNKHALSQLMVEQKPYLDPDLTLRDLAAMLDLSANYLSQLLNEGFDKNFAEFINTYRLESFKAKLIDPSYQHMTILGIAFESGFNSKTVFNTFFKKTMGKTPKAYWKEVTPK